ncbi:MAG: glutaredoxin family protein [Gammaproteobacteria bacterium]|nr:glutaredoxin family protein [Gammaproteobacteria bacterium]
MKPYSSILPFAVALVVGCAVSVSPAMAGKLYKWVDENGNVTYQDQPPPESASHAEEAGSDTGVTAESSLPVSEQLAAASANAPLTLYTIPDCDGCDLVRNYLSKRGLPFDEKSVETNVAFQQELKARAGRLEVPALLVGDDAIKGYSTQALDKALAAAGYPESAVDQGAESAATGSGGQQEPSGQQQGEQIGSEEEIDPVDPANLEVEDVFGGSDEIADELTPEELEDIILEEEDFDEDELAELDEQEDS